MDYGQFVIIGAVVVLTIIVVKLIRSKKAPSVRNKPGKPLELTPEQQARLDEIRKKIGKI